MIYIRDFLFESLDKILAKYLKDLLVELLKEFLEESPIKIPGGTLDRATGGYTCEFPYSLKNRLKNLTRELGEFRNTPETPKKHVHKTYKF